MPCRFKGQQNQLTMQRIALLFTFSCFIIASLSAQATFGLRAGYEASSVQSSKGLNVLTNQLDGIGAASFAIFAEFPISKTFSIQPELAYTSRGFALALDTDTELLGISLPLGATATSRFNYLEAPILFKAAVGDERTQAYFLAGPSIGYATSGRLRTTARAIFEFDLVDTPINLDAINYQRLSVSGVVGAGVQTKLNPNVRAFADVRYTHGFTQLYDIPLVNERLRNQSIGVNVGLALSLN